MRRKAPKRRSGASDADIRRRTIALLRADVQIKTVAEAIREQYNCDTPTRQAVSAVLSGTTRSEPLAREIARVLDWEFTTYFPEYTDR